MNLCVYTCFVYLQPFCATLDFKLFINWIHILFLLYLLLWFWDFTIKSLQDFIKIYRALIKDIFLQQMEAQRRDLERVLAEERRWAHVINHSSSFAGLRGGSPSGPSDLESTKSTTCPTLGSDGKGEMVTVAEYKAWAVRAPAWYETNSMVVPKKNSELLSSIRSKPAQVIAACLPIEMALGSDGVQKIGEVLDAYFGVDGCKGLLSAVRELIHGRRGHKPML